ncbi:hypothetical protein Ddye_030885 [Dipteronia dyeriana]|uniref:Myb-like domain-containing protein n=1 Tax=Dipteronia dyeriana TaxID=168575 RepID=A0AAD9WN46_9ROSI|nr:hypothetical protein Ddye_030885 [Dipteronia dyeriana]
MGFKRPFDDEEFADLPYKHSRQFDFSNKLTQFSEFDSYNNGPKKPNVSVEDRGGFHKNQLSEASEYDTSVEKDFETSAPFSCFTNSSSEEDSGSRPTAYASLSLDQFEFDFPRRTFVPYGESYSSLLNCSPRKQVPLGPNHQASIPSWGGCMNNNIVDCKATMSANNPPNYLRSYYSADIETEEKLMGTCIIPMPGPNLYGLNSDNAGVGTMNCDCLDEGSVRCVRQHVMEAREKLLKSLGHEKFVKLGFCDMGEEVSGKWSEAGEQVFLEVIYSNPVSSGRNFWKQLSAVFPSRTKKEIVNYYFNVFMLRRRAAQNRSHMLDIDSDDDEWHGSHGSASEVGLVQEYEDSATESLLDQADQADREEDSSDEGDNGGDDSDGDVGDCSEDAIGEDSEIDQMYPACNAKSFDVGGSTSNIPGRADDGFDVQDDSCTSFEFQPDMVDSCGPVDARSGLKCDLSKSLHGKLDDVCNDLAGHVYLMDSCDAKVWDARYPSPIKGVDFLPTCNIIDEIFGQGTWDTKTRND